MLTRLTNVKKEVLFYVEFEVWVGKVGKVGQSRVGNFLKTILVQCRLDKPTLENKFYSRLTFQVGYKKVGK